MNVLEGIVAISKPKLIILLWKDRERNDEGREVKLMNTAKRESGIEKGERGS